MAPWLQRVSNESGKNLYIYLTDGKMYDINNGESKSIDDYISADMYTKFESEFADVYGYLLKYDDYNIMINDALGKSKSVADNAIHTWWNTEYVNIDILQDEMKIWCTTNDLGIYQSDGYPKYYTTVYVSHKHGGGVSVRGADGAGVRRDRTPDVQKKDGEGQSKD